MLFAHVRVNIALKFAQRVVHASFYPSTNLNFFRNGCQISILLISCNPKVLQTYALKLTHNENLETTSQSSFSRARPSSCHWFIELHSILYWDRFALSFKTSHAELVQECWDTKEVRRKYVYPLFFFFHHRLFFLLHQWFSFSVFIISFHEEANFSFLTLQK